MYKIGKIQNSFQIFGISIVLVIVIGLIDYSIVSEFSFSIFYILPLSMLALYWGTSLLQVLIVCVIASLLWFNADYNNKEYPNLFFPIWNTFVRFCIFTIIGILLLHFKKKHQQLYLVNEELKKLNDEKSKFIGIAAHDLRTPIGNIFGFSDQLLTSCKSCEKDIKDIIDIIKTLSYNSLELIKDLLDVSLIESGKINLKFKNQDYVAFIKTQVEYHQFLAKNKNITISLISQNDEILADFDEHYMGEVVCNLLSNAIKYSQRNSMILVKITLCDKNRILTEVIDHGMGIPKEEQQILFNYFQRTSTQPTDGEQSTGLGLAIAKKIITCHNGQINVSSTLAKESNFFYTFPISKIIN